MVLTLVVFSKTLWLLPVVKRKIVGIRVFQARVAARFVRFKVAAQPRISFVPGWVEISRKDSQFFFLVHSTSRSVAEDSHL